MRLYINASPQFASNQILPGDDEDGVPTEQNPNFPWLPPVEIEIGIYIPSWDNQGGPQPSDGDSYWLCYRMENGVDGLNVGLWRTKFQKYPNNPQYVLDELAKDAQNPA